LFFFVLDFRVLPGRCVSAFFDAARAGPQPPLNASGRRPVGERG
jgi:hypothetical protein